MTCGRRMSRAFLLASSLVWSRNLRRAARIFDPAESDSLLVGYMATQPLNQLKTSKNLRPPLLDVKHFSWATYGNPTTKPTKNHQKPKALLKVTNLWVTYGHPTTKPSKISTKPKGTAGNHQETSYLRETNSAPAGCLRRFVHRSGPC